MATVTVSTPPAAMPAPTQTEIDAVSATSMETTSTPQRAITSQKKVKKVRTGGRLDGVRRNYRSVGGKTFDDTNAVKEHILQLIETKPRTPRELCKLTGYSRMNINRYTSKLAKEGKIEKDGHMWKKKNLTAAQVAQVLVENLSEEEFGQLPILKPWIEKLGDNPSRGERREFSCFRNICLGIYLPGFKCNPENWQYKETTREFAEKYKAATGRKKPPYGVRQSIRTFLGVCLGIPLRENPFLIQIGIDGEKENIGAHGDIKISEEDGELDKAIEYCKSLPEPLNLQMLALLAFNMEAMPRSERGMLIEVEDVSFEDQVIEQAWLKNYAKPVRDPDQLQMLHALALALPDGVVRFERVTRRIAVVKHLETKTGDEWETYIITPALVQAAETWIEQRRNAPGVSWIDSEGNRHEGYRYVFYDGHDINPDETQEGGILEQVNAQYNFRENLRALYRHLGKTDAYMFKQPLYTLRHCGAQLMLERSDYDYDYVAEHGWNDTATLRTWYGHRGKASLKDKLLHR
ncbi:hypothetical protein Ngar_c03440 [Candidatus Nitrososphaera gargensis Ga9.2]|uniref:Uncharacterized protein n=1 Tax=Nitrososphaera gargensis (strain Ga9.2) TaxID=1237085 RepID=K0IHK9_NITGG|nr:winged helix-turn-helix domain-containing protein [Candidatus Nitrososphaera gargensis]AFU57262.1 hypothetical protein Ngar_c03140 [Candidatus Nitrososphaera gargensis Ga9.2]AFU57292.1 hypothetical protein Ngar_c03440 [Candidatus Nitrososphaera gargensis Ga9.2]